MGKKPKFRLQPVLNYKSSQVDTLEVEFAQLKTAYQSEVDALNQIQEAQYEGMKALHQEQNGKLDCETIQLHQQYLQDLDELITHQTVKVQQVENQVENKREELVKTVKDQKTLEKLRTVYLTKQQQDLSRRETRIVDDLVISRYRSRR